MKKIIDFISETIADFLVDHSFIKEEKWSEYELLLRENIYASLTLLLIIFICIFTKTWFEALVITFVFTVLRAFVGGVHLSLQECFYFSIPTIVIFSIVAKLLTSIYIIAFLVSTGIMIYIFKQIPQNSKGNMEENLEIANNSRLLYINGCLFTYTTMSLCFILALSDMLFFDVVVSSISTGIFVTFLTLTNVGKVFLFKINKWLISLQGGAEK